MKNILLFAFILVCLSSCNKYFTPETYANPRGKFKTINRKYERMQRRYERQSKPTINPLRLSRTGY